MILAIDVGNTNTVLGLMPQQGGAPAASWRLSSHRERTADEWRGLLDPILGPHIADGIIGGAIIGSVVPAVTGPLVTLCEKWLGLSPLIVSSALDLGITLGQKQPQEVGAGQVTGRCASAALRCSASVMRCISRIMRHRNRRKSAAMQASAISA